MPTKLEIALRRSAKQHGYQEGTERFDRYVYGSLDKYREARTKESERSEAARKLQEK
jgi:hypothetical protein